LILLIACVGVLALWARIIDAYVMGSYPVSRSGSTNFFVQSAFGETDSSLVTAAFREKPTPGNVMIAVLASTGKEAPPEQDGWIRAVQSNGETPAQSIYYREVQTADTVNIQMGGLSRESHHALHVYEYRYIDIDSGLIASSSASGDGRSSQVMPDHAPAERLLDFAAVVLRDREKIYAVSPEGFSVRRTDATRGVGGVTVLGVDRLSQFGDKDPYRADFSGYAAWTMQTVTFRTAISIDAVQVLSDLGPAVTIDASSNLEEPKEGEATTFSFNVRNAGTTAISNPVFLVRVPKYLDLRSANATSGSYAPRTGIWKMSELAAGGTATLTVTADPSAGSADASFFFRALLESYDGMIEGMPLPWDVVFVHVKLYPRKDSSVACPNIANARVVAKSAAPDSPETVLALSATNATYVLVADTLDILQAEVHPYTTVLPFTRSSVLNDTIYVWFASPCDQAQVVSGVVDDVDEEVEEKPIKPKM
jgi:uncharacterized repeat protein (TIGR01451 family)